MKQSIWQRIRAAAGRRLTPAEKKAAIKDDAEQVTINARCRALLDEHAKVCGERDRFKAQTEKLKSEMRAARQALIADFQALGHPNPSELFLHDGTINKEKSEAVMADIKHFRAERQHDKAEELLLARGLAPFSADDPRRNSLRPRR